MAKQRRIKKRKSRARKPHVPLPFNGDHGPNTEAARAGKVLEEITDEKGKNPNRMARLRHVSAIEALKLPTRQQQAAQAIEEAWLCVQQLSSGGPLKQKVDASPKPDAAVAAQVDAHSRWVKATGALTPADKTIVYWVCCQNKPLGIIARQLGIKHARAAFEDAMERTADALGY